MLIPLQTLFYFICTLFTGFLLVEGWMSQAVWAKGFEKGLLASVMDMESWVVKKHRASEPQGYWTFMGLYGVAFLFFLLLIIL